MSSTLEHSIHHEHPLILKEDDVIGLDAACYVCSMPVIGDPTYTCSSHDYNIYCQNFYLHKSCAELPQEINHHKHKRHPLVLLPRRGYGCNVCGCRVFSMAYACYDCKFDVCLDCAFVERELRHPGHPEHTLTLMQRPALFKCDACGFKGEDEFFVCVTCDLCIHRTCALASLSISPTYHHHSLNLVYSIPDMHLYFNRHCAICSKHISATKWLYYCHLCTYFVHMGCATLPDESSTINEIEADGIDNEPDLVQFPLPSEELIFNFIVTQCGQLQGHVQGELGGSSTRSTLPSEAHAIEEHWSHKNHPLERLEFTFSDNDDDHNDDNIKVFICNGCILPITASNPSYYACIKCSFFLHSFCATKLPQELPAGASPFHPQHPLHLCKTKTFYSFVECGGCNLSTNGFFYRCETCEVEIDIRCAFLPARIKHMSHKRHSLVQRPFSKARCSLTKSSIKDTVAYACETCRSFQIGLDSVFYPSSMKHKYDHHPITLRYPPFFYEGVFYCEICEEQVNNNWMLYHCSESDHSFHYDCIGWYENIKLGGTIQLSFGNLPHTLALVLKKFSRSSKRYLRGYCWICYRWNNLYRNYFFECDGCGFHACLDCVSEILGQ